MKLISQCFLYVFKKISDIDNPPLNKCSLSLRDFNIPTIFLNENILELNGNCFLNENILELDGKCFLNENILELDGKCFFLTKIS